MNPFLYDILASVCSIFSAGISAISDLVKFILAIAIVIWCVAAIVVVCQAMVATFQEYVKSREDKAYKVNLYHILSGFGVLVGTGCLPIAVVLLFGSVPVVIYNMVKTSWDSELRLVENLASMWRPPPKTPKPTLKPAIKSVRFSDQDQALQDDVNKSDFDKAEDIDTSDVDEAEDFDDGSDFDEAQDVEFEAQEFFCYCTMPDGLCIVCNSICCEAIHLCLGAD